MTILSLDSTVADVVFASVLATLTLLYVVAQGSFVIYKRRYYARALQLSASQAKFYIETAKVSLSDELETVYVTEFRFYAQIGDDTPLCITTNQKRISAFKAQAIEQGFEVGSQTA